MTHVCITGRVRANIEALNMVETIGQVNKHRRAPYIIRMQDGYRLVYVPAISGESIAHAYQQNLVEAANLIYRKNNKEPPIDPWALRGEMVKFTDKEHLTQQLLNITKMKGPPEELQHEFEKEAIKSSIVADIGGFLYADKPPVRRTSLFQVGYATPIEEAVSEAVIEAQMHTRQVLTSIKSQESEEREREAQMIYYVEVASSVYGVSACIDLSGIGVTSMVKKEKVLDQEEYNRRVKTALLALAMTFGMQMYGAKRSRFSPITSVESMVGVVSKPLPLPPIPAQMPGYIELTLKKIEKTRTFMKGFNEEIQTHVIVYGANVEIKDKKDIVKAVDTIEEFFTELTQKALEYAGQKG